MSDEDAEEICSVCKSKKHTTLYCPYMELISSGVLVFVGIIILNNYVNDSQLVIKTATGYIIFSSIFNIAEFLIELISEKWPSYNHK